MVNHICLIADRRQYPKATQLILSSRSFLNTEVLGREVLKITTVIPADSQLLFNWFTIEYEPRDDGGSAIVVLPKALVFVDYS